MSQASDLIQGVMQIIKQALPSYRVEAQVARRTIRLSKSNPLAVVGLSRHEYNPITLGYLSMLEESSVDVTLYMLSVNDPKAGLRQMEEDVKTLLKALMQAKTVAGYLITLPESYDVSESARNPGVIVGRLGFRALRLVF
ncbi:MAG: hypothetical protein QW320_06620 [Ignisphaera sp.]|uniref:hypothetical protein n=1 Tax=Thermofilum sp. TaxID=1961369 RepID=UPI0031638FE6